MVDPVRGADPVVFITVSQSRSVQQDIIRKPDKLIWAVLPAEKMLGENFLQFFHCFCKD